MKVVVKLRVIPDLITNKNLLEETTFKREEILVINQTIDTNLVI
jgi:hypothetical protein